MFPYIMTGSILHVDGPNIKQASASSSPVCLMKHGPILCLILIEFGSLSILFVGFIIVRLVSSVSVRRLWLLFLFGIRSRVRSPGTEFNVTGCILVLPPCVFPCFSLSGPFPNLGNTF